MVLLIRISFYIICTSCSRLLVCISIDYSIMVLDSVMYVLLLPSERLDKPNNARTHVHVDAHDVNESKKITLFTKTRGAYTKTKLVAQPRCL